MMPMAGARTGAAAAAPGGVPMPMTPPAAAAAAGTRVTQPIWPSFIPEDGVPANIDSEIYTNARVLGEVEFLMRLTPVSRVHALHILFWRRPMLAAYIMVRMDAQRRRALRRAAAREQTNEVRRVRRALSDGRRVAVDNDGVLHSCGGRRWLEPRPHA